MIHYYQTSVFSFLQFKTQILPPATIERHYFHSFEDGLWALLPATGVTAGSTILIPDFYCEDVVHNIRAHGYHVERYQLDRHFQIGEQRLLQRIADTHAQAVVLLHAAGINNQLLANSTIVAKVAARCLVIEDCVQRLVNPSTVQLHHPRHVLMDSLRKTSPLPGSYLYFQSGALPNLAPHIHTKITWYQLSSLALFGLFRLGLLLSYSLRSYLLAKWVTEKILISRLDEVIGDGQPAQQGLEIFALPLRWFDFERIEATKARQAAYYQQAFSPWLTDSSFFYPINVPTSDWPALHVYPLGIKRRVPAHFRRYLHQHRILVWDKFPDTPWSQDKGVLFLPLGFHITPQDQARIIHVLKNFSS